MPGFNQTGPNGQGSMTGRKMGKCAKFNANLQNQTAETKENDNLSENIQGKGLGCGRGRRGRGLGQGRQNRFRGGN